LQTATPPMFLKCNLSTYNLKNLSIEFDVILIEPPLEEYQQTLGAIRTNVWNWKQVSFSTLIINNIIVIPSDIKNQ